MSFWWYGRSRGGKRYWWLIDTDPMAVLLMVPFIATVIVLNLLSQPFVPVGFILGGLACLTVAKTSLFRQGIWFSFGPGLMSQGYARLYKVGYVLIGVGALLVLLSNALMSHLAAHG